MDKTKNSSQQIYSIEGIRLASFFQPNSKHKLTLVDIDKSSSIFAVFTQNSARAAPVLVAESHLQTKEFNNQNSNKALIINAGTANMATGEKGLQVAKQSCKLAAMALNINEQSVLPFSTGVIGYLPDISIFEQGIAESFKNLSGSSSSWQMAAKAIMTTDTKIKIASEKITLGDDEIHITGIAKGSGMICPNMATMLAFVATDAKMDCKKLDKMFKKAIAQSFNRISVDGDTSTNDSALLIATNQKQIKQNQESKFEQKLIRVFEQLAKKIIEDGEGATKFITVEVENAKSKKLAKSICYDIAHSPLVKTAFFAQDANWGRIIAALGKPNLYSSKPKKINLSQIDLWIGNIAVFVQGEIAQNYDESELTKVMKNKEITIKVSLNNGDKAEKVYTNDLSYEYIKINAEYRS